MVATFWNQIPFIQNQPLLFQVFDFRIFVEQFSQRNTFQQKPNSQLLVQKSTYNCLEMVKNLSFMENQPISVGSKLPFPQAQLLPLAGGATHRLLESTDDAWDLPRGRHVGRLWLNNLGYLLQLDGWKKPGRLTRLRFW